MLDSVKKERKKTTTEIHKYILNELNKDIKDKSKMVCAYGLYEKIKDKTHVDRNDIRVNEIFRFEDVFLLTDLGQYVMKKYFDHESFNIERKLTAYELTSLGVRYNSPYHIRTNKVRNTTLLTLFNTEDIVSFKLTNDIGVWIKCMT